MRIIVLIVTIFILQFPCLGQEKGEIDIQSDCLQPMPSPFGVARQYNEKLQEILFDGISDFQLIQFRTSGERVLVIEPDTTDVLNIIYHRSKSSIWHSYLNKKSETIEIERFRKFISKDDALKVARLFEAALSNVRENNRIEIDGTSYYFADMTKAGRAWLAGIPNEKTKIQRLILICNQLTDQMLNANIQFKLSQSLSEKIENLTEEFNNKRNANN